MTEFERALMELWGSDPTTLEAAMQQNPAAFGLGQDINTGVPGAATQREAADPVDYLTRFGNINQKYDNIFAKSNDTVQTMLDDAYGSDDWVAMTEWVKANPGKQVPVELQPTSNPFDEFKTYNPPTADYRSEIDTLLEQEGRAPVYEQDGKYYAIHTGKENGFTDLSYLPKGYEFVEGDRVPGEYYRIKPKEQSFGQKYIKPIIQAAPAIIGAASGNPWLAAAGSGTSSAVRGGDLEDILKDAATAGLSSYGLGELEKLGTGAFDIGANLPDETILNLVEAGAKDPTLIDAVLGAAPYGKDFYDAYKDADRPRVNRPVTNEQGDPSLPPEVEYGPDGPPEFNLPPGSIFDYGKPWWEQEPPEPKETPQQDDSSGGGGGGGDPSGGSPSTGGAPASGSGDGSMDRGQDSVIEAQIWEAIMAELDPDARAGMIADYEEITGRPFDPNAPPVSGGPPDYEYELPEGYDPDADLDPTPPTDLPPGYRWVLDEKTGQWELEQTAPGDDDFSIPTIPDLSGGAGETPSPVPQPTTDPIDAPNAGDSDTPADTPSPGEGDQTGDPGAGDGGTDGGKQGDDGTGDGPDSGPGDGPGDGEDEGGEGDGPGGQGLGALMAMLGLRGVETEKMGVADIGNPYDFESIFKDSEQEVRFGRTPERTGLTDDQMDELLEMLENSGRDPQDALAELLAILEGAKV